MKYFVFLLLLFATVSCCEDGYKNSDVTTNLSRYTWVAARVQDGDSIVYLREAKNNRDDYSKLRLKFTAFNKLYMTDTDGDTTSMAWCFDDSDLRRIIVGYTDDYLLIIKLKGTEFIYTAKAEGGKMNTFWMEPERK